MSSAVEKFVHGIIASISDSVRNVIYERINQEVKAENEKEIANGTAVPCEASVEESAIVTLLKEHWSIDEDEATDYLNYEKTVKRPIKDLKPI